MQSSKLNYRRFYGSVAIVIILASVFVGAFMIQPGLGAWWNSAWRYRKTITIDHTKVAGDLVNFPVLVDITDADLASKAKNDGSDIAIVDGCCGFQLKHEIEYYDNATGHLVAWVKMPGLSSTADSFFYIYYDNPTAPPQQSPSDVWDSDFRMVQHFKEASGTCYDSTSNDRDGTVYGGVGQGVAGKIDGANSFDGSDDYIQVTGQDLVAGSGNTVSFWEKNMAIGTGFGTIFDDFSLGTLTGFLWQFGDSSSTFQIGNVGDWNNRLTYTHGGLVDNNWHYFTATLVDGTITLYMDGVSVATKPSSTIIASDGESVTLMRRSDGHYTSGLIDELEVSNSSRSAEWIKTCYNSQYSPGSFYSVGEEEGSGPAVSTPSPLDGATGVPVSLSELSFNLTSGSGHVMDYYVSTYPNIGGGSGLGVGNGVYTVSVSGLSYSTTYAWHVNTTDGTNWTYRTYTFSTQTPSMFDPSTQGWLYCKRLTIYHTRVAGDLVDFPLLIDVTDSDLGSHACPCGRDILFMNGPGMAAKLNHEIERYSGGHLTAWVRVPGLSSTVDTVIYMYYGKATASPQENATGVWDSNFEMVQHLKEASGAVHDSTVNDISGTLVGGVTQNVTGKIEKAAWFNGVNGYINFGNALDLTTGGATWSAWLKFDEVKVHRFIGKGANGLLIQWFKSTDGTCELQAGNIGDWSNRAVYQRAQDTSWHRVDAVFDNGTSQYKLYLDGELVAAGVTSTMPASNTENFVVGSGYINEVYGFTKGIIDEVEVSGSVRSAEWIKTCYNNQLSPSDFYKMGKEEEAGAPIITNPFPNDGDSGISTSLGHLSFNLADYQGELMNYTVTTSPNIGGSSGANVGAGAYSIPVSGLSHSTEYAWHVNVTDGSHWANVTYLFTTRAIIMLSNPSPKEGEELVSYNPTLTISVNNELGYSMNIFFSTNATGTWKTIDSYDNVGDGVYGIMPTDMTKRDTAYHWNVLANDTYGHSTVQNYTFTIVNYVAQGATPIGNSFCCRFGYIRPAREKGQYIVTWQHADHPGPWASPADTPEFAIYDVERGWVKTWTPVFNNVNNQSAVFHNSWGYWDDKYHYMDGVNGATFEICDSATWEGFQSMDFWNSYYTVGPRSWDHPTPSTYSFNNTNAWIIASDYYSGQMVMKYWPWSKTSGWGTPVPIMPTLTGDTLDAGQLLQLNRTTWRLYYADCSLAQIKYAETINGGQTWTGPYTCPELTTTSSQCNRVSFARYGDNFYIFLTDSNGDATIYNSTDGAHWANKRAIMHVNGLVHHGTLLDQGALISTIGDLGSGDPGIHYGIITPVPEMLSNPDTPSNPYPINWASLPKGTTTTTLEVMVHGTQTYNVAFYWANGTFIGEDRLLKEGDRAKVQVSIAEGTTFRWYAIARGATTEYCGNEPLATSDEKRTETYNFDIAELPELDFNQPTITCRKYSESFNLRIDLTHARNVENFEFEIHYNTTLLNYTSVSWNAWGTGTITVNEASGIITGSTMGDAFNGTKTLITMTFQAAFYHIWKDSANWQNDLTGSIYVQWANLSISEKSDLAYVKGDLNNQILVGTDFVYRFSPMQGDLNNDGTVDITDLRTVAAYYNIREGNPMWIAASPYDLNMDKIVDIFDIVLASVKYGSTYP